MVLFPNAASRVAEPGDKWVAASTQVIVDALVAAVKARGKALLALSGGSTPKPVYTRLPEAAKAAGLDWSKVTVLLVDERYVPPTHNDSNLKLVRETLLAPPASPSTTTGASKSSSSSKSPTINVLAPRADIAIGDSVKDYENRVKAALKDRGNALDVCILGLGDDGHTASLFPPLDVPLADGIVPNSYAY